MRLFVWVFCMIALLSACASPSRDSDDSRLGTIAVLERRKAFEEAIVGHTLRGDGIEITIAEGGALVGTSLGQPFVGSWEYRRGLLCTSLLDDDVRDAYDRRCYRAALDGQGIILVPDFDP